MMFDETNFVRRKSCLNPNQTVWSSAISGSCSLQGADTTQLAMISGPPDKIRDSAQFPALISCGLPSGPNAV